MPMPHLCMYVSCMYVLLYVCIFICPIYILYYHGVTYLVDLAILQQSGCKSPIYDIYLLFSNSKADKLCNNFPHHSVLVIVIWNMIYITLLPTQFTIQLCFLLCWKTWADLVLRHTLGLYYSQLAHWCVTKLEGRRETTFIDIDHIMNFSSYSLRFI